MMPREALILAGGTGTRLQALLPGIPKSLAPISGKPFLYYLIRYYQHQGVERFIFSLGYQAEQVREYLDIHFPDLSKAYVTENLPLGTGGAIRLGLRESREDAVLVLNGDSFFAGQLQGMAAFHLRCAAECTVSLTRQADCTRFGAVELGNDYAISSFSEKGCSGPGIINAGVYLLNRNMFLKNAFPDSFSFEEDYLKAMCGKKRIFGYRQDAYFIDIGVPGDYERAQTEITGQI